MLNDKSGPVDRTERGEPVRLRVLDAAERLLRDGRAAFSMRDLAAEAGVSFATPFNKFGGKAAIMHALSDRRIEVMRERFTQAAQLPTAATRVLLAFDIAALVMLDEPEVNRAVVGWLGTAGPSPGRALERSTALWTLALGAGEGFAADRREEALRCLPGQLAMAFRGALSFWTAGELLDEGLADAVRGMAATMLHGCDRAGGSKIA